jgi:hypothetical protein
LSQSTTPHSAPQTALMLADIVYEFPLDRPIM